MRSLNVGLCAAVVFASAGAANAGMAGGQQFVWDFRVDIISGPLTGETYLGSFAYTLEAPPPGERGDITSSVPLDYLVFDFIGNTYTEQDDADYPDFPRARFAGSDFRGIDYLVSISQERSGERGFGPGFWVIDAFFFYDLGGETPRGEGGSIGEGVVTYIPSPTAAAFAGLASLTLIRRRRR